MVLSRCSWKSRFIRVKTSVFHILKIHLNIKIIEKYTVDVFSVENYLKNGYTSYLLNQILYFNALIQIFDGLHNRQKFEILYFCIFLNKINL